MKGVYRFFTALAVLGIVAVVSFNLGRTSGLKQQGDLDFSLLYKVRASLNRSFLEKDKMNFKDMTYGAISGFVASLGDPYTVFLPPSENKSSEEELKGEFGGVGISLGYVDRVLAVMTPLSKTPAERAGLKAKDLIIKIVDKENKVDKDTNGISLSEAVNLIRGKVGTKVTLTIAREGEAKPMEVELIREIINVPAVELTWKEYKGKKVAWINLYKFTEKVYEQWPEIVKDIKAKNNDSNYGGIVLDLRNNPGGYLEASVLVASDFLRDGVVVTQQESSGKKQEYKVDKTRGGLLLDKMIVLVNGGSASASEILAGAIRDDQRAKLVGEKTFGKGTVQMPESFADGSGLHVTIAKWLLPSGKNIHKEGVMPDVELKWSEKVEEDSAKAMDVLLEK